MIRRWLLRLLLKENPDIGMLRQVYHSSPSRPDPAGSRHTGLEAVYRAIREGRV